ncbi:MAG: hypothetical protein ACOCWD_03625, partial [Tangfeifania sp.]
MPKAKNQLVLFSIVGMLWIFFPNNLFAQNEANVWLLNNGQQLNFDSGEPELIDFEGETEFGS